MSALDRYDPVAVTVYFMAEAGVAMFSMHPVILALSLFGALSLYFTRNGSNGMRSHALYLLLFLVMALINPLTHHNGVTVLFVLNDNPVTLEACLYGLAASGMIVSVLYWFRSYSQIMTSDKLLYLFGRFSPRLALTVSMALRYIPLFKQQAKKVNDAQKALGLYKDDNPIDAMRGGMRVFSVMVTWALENGVITADSMAARGYGVTRRSFFARRRFGAKDACLTASALVLALFSVWPAAFGGVRFVFYPALSAVPSDGMSIASYLCYGVLTLLPSLIEWGDELKWRFLKSGI